jgi:biopolymer transport protein ExbD
MSHGSGDAGEYVHPDLTPMLDVVMQLLMYFIMCVNFVGQEVNENVQLPTAQAARPIDKSEGEVLYMNIDRDGHVLVLGGAPMDMQATTTWLKERATESPKDKANGKPRTAIIIRADGGADYASVYKLMQLCKQKDFTKFKVRANMVGGGQP